MTIAHELRMDPVAVLHETDPTHKAVRLAATNVLLKRRAKENANQDRK
ncbi:hypothetical protein ACQCSX_04465 [Pseudarthrobacter sp. P1]